MKDQFLAPQFRKSLQEQGYPIKDILSDLARVDRKERLRVLRNWTGLSNGAIRDGLYEENRDLLTPRIGRAIISRLEPWTKAQTEENLPAITVKEISRRTGLAPEKVASALSRTPFAFSINGSCFTSEIEKPDLPNSLTLSDSNKYGLSPKRVAREARYQSRKPGGGPVQRARIQNSRVDAIVRTRALENQEVMFNKVVPNKEGIDFGVIEQLKVPTQTKNRAAEAIIYSEPEGSKIMKVFQWFKEVGFNKNWVYNNSEAALAENLVKLSRGEQVDFLIWNCIGFKWFKDPKGEMPSCNITDNLDAAITQFFQQRIQETAGVLSTIGNPNITILIPSNEAFDSRVWKYTQSPEEREAIINQAVDGLTDIFSRLPLPSNAQLSVARWDKYLASKNAIKSPQDYSQEGENRLRQSKNFKKIIRQAVKSGREYFASNGISNIRDGVLTTREVMYYGVYAGEGAAFEEFQKKGGGIVIVNFEEMRVSQMAFLGALGNLAIVTPIKTEEMGNYFKWEAIQIKKRV